jgi:hypothetical protein
VIKHGDLIVGRSRCDHCGKIAVFVVGGSALCSACGQADRSLKKEGSAGVPLKIAAEKLSELHSRGKNDRR